MEPHPREPWFQQTRWREAKSGCSAPRKRLGDYLAQSTLTVATESALIVTVTRRSPKRGCLNMNSCLPRGTGWFISGVSPSFLPFLHTSAHGVAVKLAAPLVARRAAVACTPGSRSLATLNDPEPAATSARMTAIMVFIDTSVEFNERR